MAGANDLLLPGGWRHDQQGRRIIRAVTEDTALAGEIVRVGDRVRGTDGVEEVVLEGVALGGGVTRVIASSDAGQRLKDAADHIATGANDHATFQAAHDALPAAGGRIVAVGGLFTFAGTAAFTKDVELDLTDTTVKRTTAAVAFRWDGSTGASTNLSVNVAIGDKVLSVGSTTGFVAGDPINLRSDEVPAGATNPDGRKGEINYVKTVDSATQITLAWPAKDAYTTATTGRIVKINFLEGAVRRGGTVTQDGPLTTQGIPQVKYKWCLRPLDVDARHRGNEQTAIEFENCLRWRCVRPDFEDFTVDYPASHFGYGIIDRGCSMFGRAVEVNAIRTGAVFGNGSGPDGIPRYGKVSLGVAVETGAGTASWSSHPECEGTVFDRCESHDATAEGFVLRGKGDRVFRPKVRRSGGIGVYIRDISRGARVYLPDIEDTGSHNIAVGGPTAEESNAYVEGGLVSDAIGAGVNVNVIGASHVKGTVVRNPNRTAAFKTGFRNVAGDTIYEECRTRDATGGSGFAFYRDAGNPQFWDPRQTNVGGALIDSASWQFIRGKPELVAEPVVASAATITPRGDFFAVTGITGITNITATYAGHIITMRFTDALTVFDGGNLFLAGNFVTAANATLTLGCNGTNWFEIARSTN